MKKNILILTSVVCVLVLAQLACSLPDLSGAQVDDSQPVNPSEGQTPVAPEAGEAQPTLAPTQSGQGNPQGNQQSQCQDGFIENTNIANGQTFQPDESFQVTWTLENTGDCTWDSGYSLKLIGGEIITSENLLSLNSSVSPGDSITLAVDMQAPSSPGNYISAWKMQDGEGHLFGQNAHPNSPSRIAIKVIPTGNQGNNPTPEPEENPDMHISGSGQTLLDGQCFDLNSGQEVDCNDSTVDIRYQYSSMLGSKIFGQNDTVMSGNLDDEPDKAYCENASYAPLPHTVLEEKFFCFEINTIIKTTYGWILVERFDEDGITFDFMTFTSNMPEMLPINPNSLFVESQGTQVTILTNECFDVQNGQLNEQCTGVFAGFLYEETTKHSLTVMQIKPNEVSFSAVMSSEPSKTDCESASYNQSPVWPISKEEYYCYKFTPGMITYFGWIRPTQFNNDGMTFDYLTWQAMP